MTDEEALKRMHELLGVYQSEYEGTEAYKRGIGRYKRAIAHITHRIESLKTLI